MKKILLILVVLACASTAIYAQEEKSNRFKDAVKTQKDADIKRKNEVLAKVRKYMGDINSRLKKSGTNTDLDVPVEKEKIEDINDTTQIHTNKKVPQRVFAYAAEETDIFTAGDAAKAVGKVKFAEELEILAKNEIPSSYKNRDGTWVVIKKGDGDEGWIHSSYLSKTKPEKKKDLVKKDEIAPDKKGGKDFEVPTIGRRSSDFGYRVHPVTKKRDSFHSGVDIAAAKGTPVNASAAGTISYAQWNNNGYGNLIIIQHEKDLSTYYGHLDKIATMKEKKVKKGEYIGNVGTTGMSTGPHLHFEIRKGGTALNPDEFMR